MISTDNTGVWDDIISIINSHTRFLISSHIHPDGDAVGSALAMRRMLEKLGKDAVWVMDDDPGIQFVPFYPKHELQPFDPQLDIGDYEVMVMLDAGEWSRLGKAGDAMRAHPGTKICIDHHIPNGKFDGTRVVDTDAPSTTILICRLMQVLNIQLTLDLAEPIYLGLIVDTQNFHLSNTTEEAHHIAAACLRAGVKPQEVHRPVYGTIRFSHLRLLSDAFKTLEVLFDGKVAVMHTTRVMFQAYNADRADDDGFVDMLRSIEGVCTGIYLREEDENTVKVSWRSEGDNDVAISARHFGGGGHAKAAGATISGRIDDVRTIVVEQMKERILKGEIG